jgi:hypothetical protein
LYDLKSHACKVFAVHFSLWGNGGPNWRGEFNLWQDEQISEWTPVIHKRSYAAAVKNGSSVQKGCKSVFQRLHYPADYHLNYLGKSEQSFTPSSATTHVRQMDHVRQVDHDRQLGSDRQRALHRVHQHVHRSNSNFKASSATGKEQFPGKSVIGTDHSSDSIFYTSNQGAVKECDLLSVGKKISSEIQGALFVTIVWCRGT